MLPTMNPSDMSSTKTVASIGDTRPVGISRFAVRGFCASNRASTRRLNPMAALRAVTMHTTIQNTWIQVTGCSRDASSAPVSANGSANTEWLKRTNEKYVRTRWTQRTSRISRTYRTLRTYFFLAMYSCARLAISSLGTSSMCVAIHQKLPNSSFTPPWRSP